MAITSNTYTGNGSNKLFSITFPYLETTDVDVYLNGVLQTITTQYFFANATTVEFVAAPANGATVKLDRSTDDSDNPATFFPGSSIKAADLNENFDQTLYVVQEINNNAVKLADPLYANKTYIDAQDATKVNKSGDTMSGNLAMGGNRVTGLGTPSVDADSATKLYVDQRYGQLGVPGLTRWRKIATAGQTVFSGVGDDSNTLAYSASRESVFVNGAYQQRGVDYTANNGTSITITPALLAGDVVDVHCVNNAAGVVTDQASSVFFTQSGAGALARTVDSKLKDVVSVKDFGAVGDGVADDTAAIQAAINSGAKLITAPAGLVLRITNTIALNVTGRPVIDFSKSELSLDDPTGLKSHIKVGDGITQRSAVIRNITFVRAQVATAGYAIDTDFIGVCEISGCRIYGNNKIHGGIKIYRGVIVDIQNNYIDNCINRGIYLEGSGTGTNRTVDVTMRENRIDGGTDSFATWNFVEGLFCRDNIFYNPSAAGATISASSNTNGLFSFKLQNNDFDSCGTIGLYIDNVSNIQVSDCWFSNNGGVDLTLKQNVDGCVISGNQMYSPAAGAIDIEGDNVVADGNLILGSGTGTLVNLDSTASNCTVTSNVISQAQYGVSLGSATDCLIEGNCFRSMSGSAFVNNAGSGTIIRDNAGDSNVGVNAFITVGASPFTYTAGPRPEFVSVFSGTVSQIALGANAIAFSSDNQVVLAPYQAVTVTYSSVPFMVKNLL